MSSNNEVLCTSCSKRHAVYLRRGSGEKLCGTCFERSLIKTIKRSLRNVKDLKPGVEIASLVIPERLVTSIAMLYTLNKVERKYNCKVVAVLTINKYHQYLVNNIINLLIKPKIGIDNVSIDVVDYDNQLSKLDISSVKVFNNYTKLITKLITKYRIVALPLTLNDLSEIILASLFNGEIKDIPIQPSFKANSQTFLIPFYSIPEYDIYVYSYIKGIYDLTLDDILASLDTYVSEDGVVIKELVNDLSCNNPELTQTLIKSFNKLLKRIPMD